MDEKPRTESEIEDYLNRDLALRRARNEPAEEALEANYQLGLQLREEANPSPRRDPFHDIAGLEIRVADLEFEASFWRTGALIAWVGAAMFLWHSGRFAETVLYTGLFGIAYLLFIAVRRLTKSSNRKKS